MTYEFIVRRQGHNRPIRTTPCSNIAEAQRLAFKAQMAWPGTYEILKRPVSNWEVVLTCHPTRT